MQGDFRLELFENKPKGCLPEPAKSLQPSGHKHRKWKEMLPAHLWGEGWGVRQGQGKHPRSRREGHWHASKPEPRMKNQIQGLHLKGLRIVNGKESGVGNQVGTGSK